MVDIVQADYAHVAPLAATMRAEDAAEIWASSGQLPHTALRLSLQHCRQGGLCWTVLLDGEPVAMFGAGRQSMVSDRGTVWLLSAPAFIARCRRPFLRHCRDIIGIMHRTFPVLENWVDARNLVSQRWLHWCGAEFYPVPVPFGIFGLPFFHFELRRQRNVR